MLGLALYLQIASNDLFPFGILQPIFVAFAYGKKLGMWLGVVRILKRQRVDPIIGEEVEFESVQ